MISSDIVSGLGKEMCSSVAWMTALEIYLGVIDILRRMEYPTFTSGERPAVTLHDSVEARSIVKAGHGTVSQHPGTSPLLYSRFCTVRLLARSIDAGYAVTNATGVDQASEELRNGIVLDSPSPDVRYF